MHLTALARSVQLLRDAFVLDLVSLPTLAEPGSGSVLHGQRTDAAKFGQK